MNVKPFLVPDLSASFDHFYYYYFFVLKGCLSLAFVISSTFLRINPGDFLIQFTSSLSLYPFLSIYFLLKRSVLSGG